MARKNQSRIQLLELLEIRFNRLIQRRFVSQSTMTALKLQHRSVQCRVDCAGAGMCWCTTTGRSIEAIEKNASIQSTHSINGERVALSGAVTIQIEPTTHTASASNAAHAHLTEQPFESAVRDSTVDQSTASTPPDSASLLICDSLPPTAAMSGHLKSKVGHFRRFGKASLLDVSRIPNHIIVTPSIDKQCF